jgi:diacylglycerol kinase
MRKYLLARLQSFIPAFQGIFTLIKHEKNALIHLIATIAAIAAGFLLQITHIEWLFVILAITLVWITELINTAIEKLTDIYQPNCHPTAKIVKDCAAGAVLLGALYSIIVAVVVFLPKLFS